MHFLGGFGSCFLMGFTGPPNGIQQDSAEDLGSGHGFVVQIFGSAQDAPKDPQSKKNEREGVLYQWSLVSKLSNYQQWVKV
jgi:hypothetical protein